MKKVTRVTEQAFDLGRWTQEDVADLLSTFGDYDGRDFGLLYRFDLRTIKDARRHADTGELECLRDLRKAVKAAGGILYLMVRDA